MAKGCESQQEPAMENSQECDPQDNTREMEGSDMETQLDLETLRHFESQFELSPADQLSSTCCYGRGKALADIVLPRLPKRFQDESYTVADPGFVDWHLAPQGLGHGGPQNPVLGCGRGKMLEMQSSILQAEKMITGKLFHDLGLKKEVSSMELAVTRPLYIDLDFEVDPADKTSAEQLPVCISPVKPVSLLYSRADNDSVLSLSERSVDAHFRARSAKRMFSVESQQDFPSLSSSGATSSRPNHRFRNKQGNVQEVNARHHSKDLHPLGAFEDVEADPKSLDELAETVLSDFAQRDSDALTCVAASDSARAFQGAGDSTGNSTSCSDANSSLKSLALVSVSKSETDLKHARPKQSTDIQKTSSNSVLRLKESDPVSSVANSSATGSFSDNIGLKDADMTVAMSVSGDGKNDQDGVSEKEVSEDLNTTGSKGEIPEIGEAADSKSKATTKNKSRTNWKLDGPLVVHVDNVPKNRGGELKTHIEALGKIMDSEKKSKKGGTAWRFRLESLESCKYVVECLHGEAVFEGSSSVVECYCLGETTDEGTSV